MLTETKVEFDLLGFMGQETTYMSLSNVKVKTNGHESQLFVCYHIIIQKENEKQNTLQLIQHAETTCLRTRLCFGTGRWCLQASASGQYFNCVFTIIRQRFNSIIITKKQTLLVSLSKSTGHKILNLVIGDRNEFISTDKFVDCFIIFDNYDNQNLGWRHIN